mmetsp:Transcript_19016/g.41152  ORF Transcript_19016/g.41152 Transcript_19016/m.41152 type:complete len:533 (+) Transcript_19016:356-1954(+)
MPIKKKGTSNISGGASVGGVGQSRSTLPQMQMPEHMKVAQSDSLASLSVSGTNGVSGSAGISSAKPTNNTKVDHPRLSPAKALAGGEESADSGSSSVPVPMQQVNENSAEGAKGSGLDSETLQSSNNSTVVVRNTERTDATTQSTNTKLPGSTNGTDISSSDTSPNASPSPPPYTAHLAPHARKLQLQTTHGISPAAASAAAAAAAAAARAALVNTVGVSAPVLQTKSEQNASSTEKVNDVSMKRPSPSVRDSDQPVADSKVVSAVNNVIALLQTYGQLSYIQLKYNIATQLDEDDNASVDTFQQMLDILVELGAIHVVEQIPETGSSLKTAGEDSGPKRNNLFYRFGDGTPRMDVVLPSDMFDGIRDAGNEVLQIKERINFLKDALRVDDDQAGRGKNTSGSDGLKRKRDEDSSSLETAPKYLQQLLEMHPEIVQDPTYVSALRMFNVEFGKAEEPDVEVEEEKETSMPLGNEQYRRMSTSSVASSSSGGDGSSRKRKRVCQKSNSSPSAIDAIAAAINRVDSPVVNENKD